MARSSLNGWRFLGAPAPSLNGRNPPYARLVSPVKVRCPAWECVSRFNTGPDTEEAVMSLIRRHPVVTFFLLAYALTWAAIPWQSFFAPRQAS